MKPRVIVHVDMDAFFASVEQRDDPSLRGKPVLVGALGKRSVVCAASYEARKFGARSAMSMDEAVRRCPHAIVVPVRRSAYSEASEHVFSIFRAFTPLVEGLSLDEAFLDVSASQSLFGDGEQIARAIRQQIETEVRLTASAGIAHTKFVAKLASDMNKPNGQTLAPENIEAFLAPLPIGRMWGIGPKTEERMKALGLYSFRHLQEASQDWLLQVLGDEGMRFQQLARGIDAREVEPDRDTKQVSAESTLAEDVTSHALITRAILGHSEAVAQRLTQSGIKGRTITLKLKFADFKIVTRRVSLAEPVHDVQSIYTAAAALLEEAHPEGARIRLIGVAVSGLTSEDIPNTLFPDQALKKRGELESLLLKAKHKTGKVITRADLLNRGSRTR
jgi:DNA polymerase IV